jgi:hypothetical protein
VKVNVDVQVERLRKALETRQADTALPVQKQGTDEGGSKMSEREFRLPRLHDVPLAELSKSHRAGLALHGLLERMRQDGRSVVEAVMNSQPYEHWKMYPWDQGVLDTDTGSQYYYHSHPQSPEHGHFHLFRYHKNKIVHLIAIAMDNDGIPISLFTVNRWVTDEGVLPATKVKSLVPRFQIKCKAFDRNVSMFLHHMLALFHEEIRTLIDRRDAAYASYRSSHAGREPYEDRELEITSSLDIDVSRQVERIETELRRRGKLTKTANGNPLAG